MSSRKLIGGLVLAVSVPVLAADDRSLVNNPSDQFILAAANVPVSARADAAQPTGPSAEQKAAIAELKLEKVMKRLAGRTRGGPGRPLLKRLSVSGDGFEGAEFTPLGGEQYVAYVTLPAGEYDLIINGKPYSESIPAVNDQVEHVVLFDHSKSTRPRVLVFSRALLQWVDSPID
ncbi:hypothetical protein [Halioxenophilus sp. WMMB6]|uniref:hypothetical protein n=1 Tax=Halioxenophilus sp. WMMB6 TaxID=3073815 RepID=UPI00295EFC24|nr:hypothetical protein [Halioxenophilus sp. WMMB6]